MQHNNGTVEENLKVLTDKDFDEPLVQNTPEGGDINFGSVTVCDGFALVSTKVINFSKIPRGSKYVTEIDGGTCIIIISGNGNPTVNYEGMFFMD